MLIQLNEQQWHIITDEWDPETFCGQALGGDVKGYIPKGRSQEPYLVCADCLAANATRLAAADALAEGLRQIADGLCCMTPGCCEDEPMCDVMIARAALRQWREATGEEAE